MTTENGSSGLTSFGRVIAKIIDFLNNYRTEHVMDPSQVVPYTIRDLAHDINCSLVTMYRYCNWDPQKGRPQQYPTRHTIVKIIAIAALPPDLVEELLGSVGYAINPSYENAKFVDDYKRIIEHPHRIPKTVAEATEITDEINVLLKQAVEKGAPYRGSIEIQSIFVLVDES